MKYKGVAFASVTEIGIALKANAEMWFLGCYFAEDKYVIGNPNSTFLIIHPEIELAKNDDQFRKDLLSKHNILEEEFFAAVCDLEALEESGESYISGKEIVTWPKPHLMILPENNRRDLIEKTKQLQSDVMDGMLHYTLPEPVSANLQYRNIVWVDVVTDKGIERELAVLFDNYDTPDSGPKAQRVLTESELRILWPLVNEAASKEKNLEIDVNEMTRGIRRLQAEQKRLPANANQFELLPLHHRKIQPDGLGFE